MIERNKEGRTWPRIDHAFRTPIALVLAEVEALLSDTPSDSLEANRLREIQRNVLRLLNLVDGLLALSRSEETGLRPRLEDIDLSNRVNFITDRFKSVMERAGIAFYKNIPSGISLRTDPEMLDRIILNLLSNALKFTFEGEIRLSVSPEDGFIRIRVEDDGIGMSSEGIAQALTNFRDAVDESRDAVDAGIGLAVVNVLSKALGGDVTVSSGIGDGTVVQVDLPVSGAPGISGLVRIEPSHDPVGAFVAEAERWVSDVTDEVRSVAALRWKSPARGKVALVAVNADLVVLLEKIIAAEADCIVLPDTGDRRNVEVDLWIVSDHIPLLDRSELTLAPGLKLLLADGAVDDDAVAGFDEILHVPFGITTARMRIVSLLARARMEKQLGEAREHSYRLDAMARVVGGTSHDFSNLLVSMLGNLDMASRSALSDEAATYIANVKRAAERGARLTKHLLSFSQSRVSRPRVVDVNDVVASISDFLEMTIGGMVGLSMSLGKDVGAVKVDASGFDLSLINLSLAARDSLSGPGNVLVTTENTRSNGRNAVHISFVAVAHEPIIGEIGDPDGVLDSIGQVRSFAMTAGGHVELQMSRDGGGKFILTLPAASDGISEPVSQSKDMPVHAPLKVLTVDDDPGVREVSVTLLGEMGHNVVSASGGRDAVRLLEEENFDLLIVDYAMPDMTGLEVSIRARALHPDIGIVIATGYADSARLDERDEVVLRKPFGMVELGARVEEALKKRPGMSVGVTKLFSRGEED